LDWKLWLWVFLCTIGIFATIPVARSIQKFVYATFGREFFTYIVLFIVGAGLTVLLYLFIFQFRAKRPLQYIWLFICAGLYVYFTLQLKAHPEEAIHLIEYGLLSYFLFKALSYPIPDWTIYITAVLFVLFFGTIDEFLQWMMPQRYFYFKDIGLDTLAGGIALLFIWKGIGPEIICKPVRKISIKVLVGIITIDLIFLSLCLSNTPKAVTGYTNAVNILSWLQKEEAMAEFGYSHKDPEIGAFLSRMSLKELKEIDLSHGEYFGKILPDNIITKTVYEELIKIYNQYTNPFLYEFIIHVSRRDSSLDELPKINDLNEKNEMANTAYRENLLIEKYFGNTLKHYRLILSDEKVRNLKKIASLWKGEYISRTGNIITSFSLKKARIVVFFTLIIVWTLGERWKRRLDN